MPQKRQRQSSDKGKDTNVKVRRVIIDSDEEENETVAEQAPNDVNENIKQLNTNEIDEIVSEAYYKSQVKHLRLRFGEEEQIFDEGRGGIVSNSKGGSGGIADLLRPKSELNPSTSNTNVDGKSSGE
uniref:Uncharacterized protein n=1 Tax=Meloidogyne javanica TaxID=6303 RepID=A0A915MNY2_MELJA